MPPTYPDAAATKAALLCAQLVRAPDGIATESTTGAPLLTFVPSLTPAEQTIVDNIIKTAASAVSITPAERTSIEANLTTLRSFQQLSQADLIAMTQNARDRLFFDNVTALLRVVRVLLRD